MTEFIGEIRTENEYPTMDGSWKPGDIESI
jgi:hypothetical protein